MGLGRPELRAWAMYDWAASSVQTTIMVAVFPIYFVKVAGAGIAEGGATQRLATINSIALLIIALVSPLLGAISDYRAAKKRFTAIFLGIGVVACCGLFLVGTGDLDLGSWLFIAIMVGVAGSFVFYEALLPHIAAPHEIDRVSAAGYAMGYLGGGLLLALNLAWIQMPAAFGLPSGEGLSESEATLPARLAFLSVAVWWALFSIPLFRRVPEPPVRDRAGRASGRESGPGRLRATGRDLPRAPELPPGLPDAARLPDLQRRHPDHHQDGDGLRDRDRHRPERPHRCDSAGAVRGHPLRLPFRHLAGRIGAKRAVFLGLLAYTVISILGYYMTTATHFFILAGLVGMVQGGTQALSRSRCSPA